jgi:soluble lytic murein transglycosylase-like protein
MSRSRGEHIAVIAALLATLFWALIILACCLPGMAHAQEIPRAASAYRSILVRSARAEWGLSAPVAVFAAQVHQESLWRSSAQSPAGAQGLAQFMPATARWLPEVAPQTGQPAPFNPGWSLRALCAYDHWLWARVQGANDCERMAMTLSAYNGGLAWLHRDKRRAVALGRDQRIWWNGVELVNAGRSAWAWRENRDYPRRILLRLEPLYEASGWGRGICP